MPKPYLPFFLKFVRRPIISLALVVALILTATLVLDSYFPRASASQIVVITIPKTTGATTGTGVICEETPNATIHMDLPGWIVLETAATTEEKINLTTAYWNLKLYVEVWKNKTLERTMQFDIIKEGIIFIDGLTDSCALLAGDHDVVIKTDYWTMPVTEAISGTFTLEIEIVELQPCLWIWKHGAKVWPEWQVRNYTDTQTLYARIVNTGNLDVYTKVRFIVSDPSAMWATYTTWSNIDTVPSGGNVTLHSDPYYPPGPGTFWVKAVLYYSYDNIDWIAWSDVQAQLGGQGVSRDVATKYKVLA